MKGYFLCNGAAGPLDGIAVVQTADASHGKTNYDLILTEQVSGDLYVVRMIHTFMTSLIRDDPVIGVDRQEEQGGYNSRKR